MIANTTFGQWLRQRRKALGLTQKALAQQAGCAEVTLRKIEAGDLQPSAPLVASLAQALGMDDADLPGLVSLARDTDEDFAVKARLLRPQRPNNLPAQLTPLIGREQDVAVVRKRLLADGARLVTLLGPPGVGKTRLSLAVAEEVLEQFEDGVFFVRLAPVSDPALVASAITQALGMQMSGPNPAQLQLRAYLQQKHLLLVLDNFEHVVAVAPLVDDLLRRCPWLHVLVTSRQPLRVRGERQMPVLPLALPAQASSPVQLAAADALRYPGVALFAERAEAVQPDFTVTDHNAASVAELCRHLDGLPLAIELVAARVKLLRPAELLARLSGSWMLSVNGLRDVSDRQKTLRGAIGWSYDLLTPAEQALFNRLAVFAGGCTLEAAEAVCAGGETSILDDIASLLDKSLLRRELGLTGESRYVMLETVREYALERLEAAGGEEETRNRHLAWCLTIIEPALAAPFSILGQAGWGQIDAESHNLRAGLEWAYPSKGVAAMRLILATSRLMANRGLARETLTWLNSALALPEAARPTAERAALLYSKGVVEFLTDQFAEAENALASALELCRDLDLTLGQAGVLYYLGRLASIAGNALRAEEQLEAAAVILLEAGEIADWGHVISVLAEIVMFRGDLARSRALHTQALTRPLPLEERHQVFWAIGGLAELALVEGDYDNARRLSEECLALCRQRSNPGEIAWPLTCIGEIAIRCRDFAAAHAALDEALRLGRQADSYWRIVIVNANLGDLAVAEGKAGEALRLYRETLPILLQRGIFAHPQGSLRLSCLASALGQHEVAITLLGACAAAVEGGIEVLFPITQADFDCVLAAAKMALAPDSFEVAWTKGRSLGPQDAVAWGLEAIQVLTQH